VSRFLGDGVQRLQKCVIEWFLSYANDLFSVDRFLVNLDLYAESYDQYIAVVLLACGLFPYSSTTTDALFASVYKCSLYYKYNIQLLHTRVAFLESQVQSQSQSQRRGEPRSYAQSRAQIASFQPRYQRQPRNGANQYYARKNPRQVNRSHRSRSPPRPSNKKSRSRSRSRSRKHNTESHNSRPHRSPSCEKKTQQSSSSSSTKSLQVTKRQTSTSSSSSSSSSSTEVKERSRIPRKPQFQNKKKIQLKKIHTVESMVVIPPIKIPENDNDMLGTQEDGEVEADEQQQQDKSSSVNDNESKQEKQIADELYGDLQSAQKGEATESCDDDIFKLLDIQRDREEESASQHQVSAAVVEKKPKSAATTNQQKKKNSFANIELIDF